MLNLEGMEYVSSRLLATLVCLHHRVAGARGFLKLCRLEPRLHETLRVCRLDSMFEIDDTEGEALATGDAPASHEESRAKTQFPGG